MTIMHSDLLSRRKPDPHANAAAAREARRQHDRELLEAAWRRLTMPQREVRPS